ncbi:MAG: hypothetical protein FWE15_20105 [Actinomycetia bacterium]|nr:hypothetical protein [Actinomycetes bacterium]
MTRDTVAGPLAPYDVVVREDARAAPVTHRFASPADALLTAIAYMCRAYWVRLTDPTVAALDDGTSPEVTGLRDTLARARHGPPA